MWSCLYPRLANLENYVFCMKYGIMYVSEKLERVVNNKLQKLNAHTLLNGMVRGGTAQLSCVGQRWHYFRISSQQPSRGTVQHDDVIKWKHFPRNWPFARGIHRSPVNSLHKGQWCEALMFSFICVWINDWVNNREAGDLRRYRVHCDVIVMVYSGWVVNYAPSWSSLNLKSDNMIRWHPALS